MIYLTILEDPSREGILEVRRQINLDKINNPLVVSRTVLDNILLEEFPDWKLIVNGIEHNKILSWFDFPGPLQAPLKVYGFYVYTLKEWNDRVILKRFGDVGDPIKHTRSGIKGRISPSPRKCQ